MKFSFERLFFSTNVNNCLHLNHFFATCSCFDILYHNAVTFIYGSRLSLTYTYIPHVTDNDVLRNQGPRLQC